MFCSLLILYYCFLEIKRMEFHWCVLCIVALVSVGSHVFSVFQFKFLFMHSFEMMFETVLVFGPIIAQFALILCWNAAFEAFVTPQRVFGFVWSSASGAFVAHPVGIYQRMQRKIPNPTCHVISKVKRAKRKHNYVSICTKKIRFMTQINIDTQFQCYKLLWKVNGFW